MSSVQNNNSSITTKMNNSVGGNSLEEAAKNFFDTPPLQPSPPKNKMQATGAALLAAGMTATAGFAMCGGGFLPLVLGRGATKLAGNAVDKCKKHFSTRDTKGTKDNDTDKNQGHNMGTQALKFAAGVVTDRLLR